MNKQGKIREGIRTELTFSVEDTEYWEIGNHFVLKGKAITKLLAYLDSKDAVIKVDKKINGNLVNNLWDAMQPVDLGECRLLVKQALEGAGYSAWEPLIKEEENETT